MSINEYLKQLRIDKNISQRQLARLSGVDSSYISRYERNERIPSPDVLLKLSPYLGVTFEHLMDIAGFTNYLNPQLPTGAGKTEGILRMVIKDLVSKNLIKSENDIPQDIMKILIDALKLEIKLQLSDEHLK